MCDSAGEIAGFTSERSGGCRVKTASRVPSVLSALNGRAAGEHFVEHGAEREDVRASIDDLAAHLLRCHVSGGAGDERSRGLGWTFLRRVTPAAPEVVQCREAEIEDLHAAVQREEDVLRLQVAMHDAACVRGAKPPGHLERDVERRVHRQRAGAEARAQRLAFQTLRHEVGAPP